jgi:hypothetical protein
MYESGGQMHWIGHIGIMVSLMLVSLAAAIVRWHENWLVAPFVLYFGYLILKAGSRTIQSVRRLLGKS